MTIFSGVHLLRAYNHNVCLMLAFLCHLFLKSMEILTASMYILFRISTISLLASSVTLFKLQFSKIASILLNWPLSIDCIYKCSLEESDDLIFFQHSQSLTLKKFVLYFLYILVQYMYGRQKIDCFGQILA